MGGGATALLNPTAVLGTKAASAAGKAVLKKVIPEPPELGAVPELPEAPGVGDPEVQAAKKKERKASRLRQGRQTTILSNLRQQLSPGKGAGGTQLG